MLRPIIRFASPSRRGRITRVGLEKVILRDGDPLTPFPSPIGTGVAEGDRRSPLRAVVDTKGGGMYNIVRFCPGSFANSQGDCLQSPQLPHGQALDAAEDGGLSTLSLPQAPRRSE